MRLQADLLQDNQGEASPKLLCSVELTGVMKNSTFNNVYANMAESRSTHKSHGLSFAIILLALAYKLLSRHDKCFLLKENYNNS